MSRGKCPGGTLLGWGGGGVCPRTLKYILIMIC